MQFISWSLRSNRKLRLFCLLKEQFRSLPKSSWSMRIAFKSRLLNWTGWNFIIWKFLWFHNHCSSKGCHWSWYSSLNLFWFYLNLIWTVVLFWYDILQIMISLFLILFIHSKNLESFKLSNLFFQSLHFNWHHCWVSSIKHFNLFDTLKILFLYVYYLRTLNLAHRLWQFV